MTEDTAADEPEATDEESADADTDDGEEERHDECAEDVDERIRRRYWIARPVDDI